MKLVAFRMPALGADMESGTLTQWLKQRGERVHRGEPIAAVETAKGVIDIESFDDGVLQDIVAQPGDLVPVGAVLAHIASDVPDTAPAQSAAITAPPADAIAQSVETTPQAPEAPRASPAPVPSTRARISPAARRRALELGIDPGALTGAASDEHVGLEDVEAAARARATAVSEAHAPQAGVSQPAVRQLHVPEPQAQASASAAPLTAMRATIGAAMSRAKREIPHYYVALTVDFGPARAWLAEFNASVPATQRLLDAVLLVKAVARAAAAEDGFNGYFLEGRFQRSAQVHVGTAVALRGGGLVAPALMQADTRDLPTLMRDLSDLVARVRRGHVRASELTSPTITVTQLGIEGAEALYPIINPPQVAIVGAGAIVERPWLVDGQILARPVCTLTLAADHRVTDGRAGSQLLCSIATFLSRPAQL